MWVPYLLFFSKEFRDGYICQIWTRAQKRWLYCFAIDDHRHILFPSLIIYQEILEVENFIQSARTIDCSAPFFPVKVVVIPFFSPTL